MNKSYLQHMLECEARYHLAQTGGDKRLVDELIARIAKKRGETAAENLRKEMRAQYLAVRQ